MTKIHTTAVIEDGATIGADVEIGPYSVIYGDTVIGDGCQLGPHVVVHPYTELGEKCRVHSGVVLGDLPQDLSFADVTSRLVVGPRTVMREGFTAHRGTDEGSETRIGADCYMMANSHVGHNSIVGDRVILVNGALLAGHVTVDEGAILSGLSAVHQFCHIGRLVIMGGGSMVSKDVPPFCMVHSMEGNLVAGLNVVGLRRAGFTPEQRKEIKSTFKRLFVGSTSIKVAAEELVRELDPESPAAEMARFVTEAKRGVVRYSGTVSK